MRGALVGALALAGCLGGEAPVVSSNPEGKAKTPPAGAEAATPPAVEKTFVYSSVGKRDPFRSYMVEMREVAATQVVSRKHEDTERFELDQYRLTGVITGTSRPKAMVEDPTGRGHVVHVGSRLGRNGGRIGRIGPTGLTVVEEARDGLGRLSRMPIEIRLPKPDMEAVAQDN